MQITLLLLLILNSGCSSDWPLMPSPNLYVQADQDPFADVPAALQTNTVDVLYMTDRKPKNDNPQYREYGYDRSRSVAFGISHMQIGENVTWPQLVDASRRAHRKKELLLKVTRTEEIGRFPPTPRTLVELPTTGPAGVNATRQPTTVAAEIDSAKHIAADLLARQLAKSDVKDVYVFVHGYNNTFTDSIITIGQLWHFLGRKGVPIAYSWPAGHGGLLRGYTYDRESSEFTVYHLKEMLRFLAAQPEVHRIHLIAHSRGTDVASSALRELHLEISGSGKSTREELKLGTLILAAPDLDLDVVIQRLVTARVGRVPKSFALYVCSKDEALGMSNWFFAGRSRLGMLQSKIFTPEELKALRESKSLQIIDARISKPGPNAHSYFYENPAVSSDVILLLRYGIPPGAPQRPLRIEKDGFWVIDDTYPAPPIGEPQKVAKTD